MTDTAPVPVEHRTPPGVTPLIHGWLRGEIADGPIRDAATVVVLRDSPDGVEVFLQRRVASMKAGAGQYVFPGGLVDPADSASDLPWAGPPPAEWAAWLECSESAARSLVCAAVRETFEECGILLAGPSAASVVPDVATPDWVDDRRALARHELSLSALLARRGLVLRSDLLHPLARWLTPEWAPRRFDTRFFVTELPAGQTPQPGLGESDDDVWLPVAAALDRYAAEDLAMMLPTVEVLRTTHGFPAVADVLAAPRDLQTNQFVVVTGDGGRVWVETQGVLGARFAYAVPAE